MTSCDIISDPTCNRSMAFLRGGCAREHFGLKFAREMYVVCGGMQLKVSMVKK